MIAIHDPIHGTIEVTHLEIKLVDSRAFQRLRYIKQLGFSELAFPGATHSRYAHSLGAMQMATRIIDRLLPMLQLPAADAQLIRQAVRLAVLFHDLGHPPMSHVSERFMPPFASLHLQDWQDPNDEPNRQATHEDYTLKILLDSELTEQINTTMQQEGVVATMLASLICGRRGPLPSNTWVFNNVDLLPLLSQIVSGEIDADRMDYLRRDAYYCGVSYGHFDHIWLTNNLTCVNHQNQLVMALQHKGVWAFENFLLARYHMFLAVYHHHTKICFDYLLGQFYNSGEYQLPATADAYLQMDDIHLQTALRASKNIWAKHVVNRRPYKLLLETHDYHNQDNAPADLDERLQQANIDFFRVRSRGILSKYMHNPQGVSPLLVVEAQMHRVRRIEDYTPLYQRFEDVVGISRIYCRPEHFATAQSLLT